MLSTLCRVGELTMARWEHVNLDDGEWTIPKANVKGKVSSLTVYLSEFAAEQFRKLKAITGDTDFCFPNCDGDSHIGVKSISKQIGDRECMFKKTKSDTPRKPLKNRHQSDALTLSGGANGAWTPHDLRRTGATLMQRLKIEANVIDHCQNHVLAGSKVRRHYLQHDFAQEKKDAWQKLGAHLNLILSARDNIIVGEFGGVA
jgi:integrase